MLSGGRRPLWLKPLRQRTDSLAPGRVARCVAEAPQAELPAAGRKFPPVVRHGVARTSVPVQAVWRRRRTGNRYVVAFGTRLCGAGRFSTLKMPDAPCGDRDQGAGIPLPDLPFRGEIHGFSPFSSR